MLPVPPTEAAAATGIAPVENMDIEPSSESSLPGVPTANNSGETADQVQGILDEAAVWGWWVFGKLEAAGELVAGILGLNESRFSYVIENMTDEDWKVAKRVHAKREAQLAGRPFEEMEGGDVKPVVPPAPPTEVQNRE